MAACAAICLSMFCVAANAQIVPIANPDTILGDWPQYVDPILPDDYARYQGQPLVNTSGGDLAVRAWKYSSGLDAIIESNNVLASEKTALIVVHPWGIEDGQGWGLYQAYNENGYVFLGHFPDNEHYLNQVSDVLKGFVDSSRGRVPLVIYGMPGEPGEPATTRYKLYRDYTHQPSLADQADAREDIETYLGNLTGTQWPETIPVAATFQYAPCDVVAYDSLDYTELKNFLDGYGIYNVLLAGVVDPGSLVQPSDTSLITSASAYISLKDDFNVFVVGDATMTPWTRTVELPNLSVPSGYVQVSTRDAVIAATAENSVAATQVSWIAQLPHDPAGGPAWRGDLLTGLAEWDNWQKTVSDDDPLRDSRRAPDYWETNLNSGSYATDHFADEFDEGKIEVLGTYEGRTNVAKVNPLQELALHLPTPNEDSTEGRLWLKITWLRDGGSPTQEPVWTLDLYNGGTPGGDGSLLLESRDVGEGGWLTDIYSATLPAGAESTILRLGFDDEAAYVDSMVVDLKIGMPNYPGDVNHDGRVDEIDSTLLAANWGAQGGATWSLGDVSGDGKVDGDDAAIIAANWLVNYLEPTAAAAPEPSTATCLFVLTIAALFAIPHTGRKRPG